MHKLAEFTSRRMPARSLEALGFLQITLAAEKLAWTGGFAVVA